MKQEFIIKQSHVGLLYENGAFADTLKAGQHIFKSGLFSKPVVREVVQVDMRDRSLSIKGQEILTQDKVAIRVTLLVYFKVMDAQAAVHNVASYEDRIYEDVQLAARRFLAGRSLEAILNDRNDISDAVKEDVQGAAARYGVEILRADVKDLVFPGNLREIMNQVLETERRAEARIIETQKNAEAARIQLAADREAAISKLETETEKHRLSSEAETARLQQRLQIAVQEAESLAKHPLLLEIRRFDTLKEMAKHGGTFYLGLDASGLPIHPTK